jgi:TnpA family transposase
VLSTVNKSAHFLDAFEHWQVKYTRAKPPDRIFWAGIIGYGCNIGTNRIAKISQQINESELENAINWYFSDENVKDANDRVIRITDQLELPNVYRKDKKVLRTSSDGQKYSVAVDSIHANYSFKYFGKGKGVTVYSFIDERNLLFHSTVISSSEREAAYVIDGLMHNDVIKSDIHSTDTHGYSKILSGVVHLLGFSFAPRIKNLKDLELYSFQKKRLYAKEGYKILPDKYINTKLIEDNWDEILRFIATIKLRETTASQLFRRLNSYSKQHPLYEALEEFGKITRTIFILRYIDDVEFRQTIMRMVNKIESAHRFTRAVAFGNNQEFMQGSKEEQNIAQGCRRLIENAIICWNYLYLSQKIIDETSKDRRQELVDSIRNGSIVSWQHLNLHGEYDFSEDRLRDSVGLRIPEILKLKVL